MIIYSDCPICQDPLVNEFSFTGAFCDKLCTNKLDHKFSQHIVVDNNILLGTALQIAHNINFIWREYSFTYNGAKFRLSYIKGSFSNVIDKMENVKLPYFEPDFSNYKQLSDKLKIYILLS